MAGDDYEGPLIFVDDQFEDELEMGDDAFVLIGKEVASNSKIPEAMFPLLEEFLMFFMMSCLMHCRLCVTSNIILIWSLVHNCLIDHIIDCAPESMRSYVQDFVEGLPYHGDSSNDDLVGNSRTNFVYLWGNDEGPTIKERALLFLETQDRMKKKAYMFRDA
nr:putative reverse transcriptase domain-containing protein [Tanacetum cinerariifolium]